MSKHTPGPWVVNEAGSAIGGMPFKITEFYVYAPKTQDDTAICADVIDPVTQEPSMSNARLISAAPDLMEELENCMDLLNTCFSNAPVDSCIGVALIKARSAIAKATGQ